MADVVFIGSDGVLREADRDGVRSLHAPKMPRCTDFDADCDEVENKTHCWLYDPARGFCPWLTKVDP